MLLMSWRMMGVPLLAFFALLFDASPATSGPPESMPSRTLDEIRDILIHARMQLSSLKAVVTSQHNVENPGDNVKVWNVFAAVNELRYERQWHGDQQWTDDSSAIFRFYDGKHFNLFDYYDRRYEVCERLAVIPYIDKIRTNALLESLGWWPPGDKSAPLRPWGEPFYIHEIITDPRCQLEPQLERIDGAWCHVVTIPNVLKMWVDTKRGVVRKREHFRVTKTGHREPAILFELTNFKEIRSNLWLPTLIHRKAYDPPIDTYHCIVEYELNNLRPELFQFNPPPGTIVCDRDTDNWAQVPGGLDFFEQISVRVRESVMRSGSAGRIPLRQAGWFGIGMALALACARSGRRWGLRAGSDR